MPDETSTVHLQSNDALLIVDVQQDFCPGGALAVPDGSEIIPVLNQWIRIAQQKGALIVASRDWHPPGHASFLDQGGNWPLHCRQDTDGAMFHPDLRLPDQTILITKGDHPAFDQYSAFDQTGLADALRDRDVERVWIGGLALDVCVRATAMDAANEGFETHVLLEATRPVNVNPGDEVRAIQDMREAGVIVHEQESSEHNQIAAGAKRHG